MNGVFSCADLLDTHVFLWMVQSPQLLSPVMRDAVTDGGNDVYYSAVVSWEVGVKRAKGKLLNEISPLVDARKLELIELAITAAHSEASADLPAHHHDPFDRLLVAQAQLEGLTLATRDPLIEKYQVSLLPA